MKKAILILFTIEIIIIIWGISAIIIADYLISKEELRLQKERQEGLKIHTVYKNCWEDEDK